MKPKRGKTWRQIYNNLMRFHVTDITKRPASTREILRILYGN